MTGSSKYQRFAVAGGTGKIGEPIVSSLAAAGFDVTVLSRSAKPSSDKHIVYKQADYADEAALVEVLKGHDVVIDALGFPAVATDRDLPQRLATAAKSAGAKLFVPNDWSFDMERIEKLANPPAHPFMKLELTHHEWLQNELHLPFLGFWTGLFAPLVPFILGVDLDKKTASFVGKGDTPFVSTGYHDIGRFVAAAFTHLDPSQLANRTLRVVGQLSSANEILATLAEALGTAPFEQVDNLSVEEATERAANIDPTNLMASAQVWMKLVVETGSGGGQENAHALVHFAPQESTVDAILAARRPV